MQHYPPNQKLLNNIEKQLILVEAVKLFPTLFRTNNPWNIAKELISLFDECALSRIPLDADADQFNDVIAKAYSTTNNLQGNISRESEIIHRLWIAYTEEISARGFIDPVQHYCQSLLQQQTFDRTDIYYLLGKHYIAPVESLFLANVAEQSSLNIYYPEIIQHSLTLALHPHQRYIRQTETKQNSPTSERSQALDIIYSGHTDLYSRIETFRQTFTKNPFSSWLSIHQDTSVEGHVLAVCMKAKQWLLENKLPIAIVSNDRSLSRRIRAVLENEGIYPRDLGGWTLSTTSAATSIELLLNVIETNFNQQAVLEFASSPFSDLSEKNLFILQQIFSNKNVARQGEKHVIGEYIRYTLLFSANQQFDCSEVITFFEQLKAACGPLLTAMRSNNNRLALMVKGLLHAIQLTGLEKKLLADDAGIQLLNTTQKTTHAISQSTVKLGWKDWRQWLREQFENDYFSPDKYDERVTICGLEHLDHHSFHAIILAGAEKKRLNSTAKSKTFFNENVRHELCMQTSYQHEAINFVRFRKIISQYSHVMLTAQNEIDGEPQEMSHWVEQIRLFCQQAFNDSLKDNSLVELIRRAINQAPLNNKQKSRPPLAKTAKDLLPNQWSATRYQSLIDCPYQFYCKYILALKPIEAEEEFSASDFGTLVHQCLHTFHFDREGLPKEHLIELSNRTTLIDSLNTLSHQIFASSTFPRSLVNAWLQRWLINIPGYIDWLIQTNEKWSAWHGEIKSEASIKPEFTLFGQIDRLDVNKHAQNYAVIDYKTGATIPTRKNILLGEAVQLPFYSLLNEKISKVAYLDLGNPPNVNEAAVIKDDELRETQQNHRDRLILLFEQLYNAAELPANGDESACSYCDYEGMCRKSHWTDHSV